MHTHTHTHTHAHARFGRIPARIIRGTASSHSSAASVKNDGLIVLKEREREREANNKSNCCHCFINLALFLSLSLSHVLRNWLSVSFTQWHLSMKLSNVSLLRRVEVATRNCNASHNAWWLCMFPSQRPARFPSARWCIDTNLFALLPSSASSPLSAFHSPSQTSAPLL